VKVVKISYRRLAGLDPARRGLMFGFVTALALAGCTTVKNVKPEAGNSTDQTVVVLPLINKLRAEHGLSAVALDPAAMRAAADQANRMSRTGQMEHNIGFGANFADRMNRMGVSLQAAENIAEGQATPERAFDAWVHSPKHLKNMLGPYKGLGVAQSENSASGNRPFWSMVLSN
jgi:uncharacterized protein YkwD